jgi:hypothetical protein
MRIALLSAVAKLLRVRFKVDGIPHGSLRVSVPSSEQTFACD